MSNNFSVILYYNFKPIANPEIFCDDHRRFCQEHDLLGRVYIAAEGINGTLAGLPRNINAYKDYLRSLDGFQDTEFKEDLNQVMPFVKLKVKTRPEIVALKSKIPFSPFQDGGRHLTPQQWKEALESNEEFVLIDVRNNYESHIGYFDKAIRPNVENFYDFPQWLEEANIPKEKKVLMYCTGGIRCEKFSIYMKELGYNDVNQLHGGIINYGKTEGGTHFHGKCFVFDDRLAVPVNEQESEIVSRCEITGAPCDSYLNCANLDCNKLFVCSTEGAKKFEGCCSEACMHTVWRKPFSLDETLVPKRKWYNYFETKIKN